MVLLSDDTMCRRIDIHNQLIDEMKQREFSLQLDEATDGSRDVHLICYVLFVDFSNLKLVEELLFCKPIKLGCRGIDLFNIINNFISTNHLDWEKCISLCTDGAKAMSGSCSGLRSLRLALHNQVSCRKILALIFYLCIKYRARSLSKIAGNIAQ